MEMYSSKIPLTTQGLRFQEISNGPTEQTPKPEYLIALAPSLRGPLGRFHSIFDGKMVTLGSPSPIPQPQPALAESAKPWAKAYAWASWRCTVWMVCINSSRKWSNWLMSLGPLWQQENHLERLGLGRVGRWNLNLKSLKCKFGHKSQVSLNETCLLSLL